MWNKFLIFVTFSICLILYIIPLMLISVIALFCEFFNIHEDLTSTKQIVKFISPLRKLDSKWNLK